jgi:hypothetical protein
MKLIQKQIEKLQEKNLFRTNYMCDLKKIEASLKSGASPDVYICLQGGALKKIHFQKRPRNSVSCNSFADLIAFSV